MARLALSYLAYRLPVWFISQPRYRQHYRWSARYTTGAFIVTAAGHADTQRVRIIIGSTMTNIIELHAVKLRINKLNVTYTIALSEAQEGKYKRSDKPKTKKAHRGRMCAHQG